MLVDDPFIHHLLNQKIILDISKALLGLNTALFGAHYIAKRPYDGRPVGWHQDGSYWPLKPMNVISLWIAGTQSNKENGCMRVIPGSQNKKLLKPSDMVSLDANKYVLDLAINKNDVNEKEAIDIELKPGDISIHNPNIIHGSNSNYSDKWRMGLTIRIIPTTTLVDRKNWDCILLTGRKNTEVKNSYIVKPTFKKGKHMKFDGFEKYL
jgi:phytanoyl-CoA hydroxylase